MGLEAHDALAELRAEDTELSKALMSLGAALADWDDASGKHPDLEERCHGLVLAGDRVQAALSDPVRALREEGVAEDDAATKESEENAPRGAPR